MPRITITLIGFLLLFCAFGQEVQLVKDSVMNVYMESGLANKLFEPEGRTDKQELRQGKWKDYRVEKDFVMFPGKDYPRRITAHYLTYGEGQYVDGKREGPWICWTIEDKTFKHLPYKRLSYINGVEQGPVTYSFLDGHKGMETTYVNGAFDGAAQSYYPEGGVHVTFTYVKGRQDGNLTGYYRDGQLKLTKELTNDTLDGPFVSYYPGGQVEERCSYAKDKKHGTQQYYYTNGQIWTERVWDHGRMMTVTGTYDAQGAKLDHGTLKDGNGTLNLYDEEGKVYLVQTYKDGEEIGKEER